jgi:hypothetical protein
MHLLQALAQALGGSVRPNPSGDFVLTTEHVQPTQELQQFKQLAAVVQAALTSTQEAASLPAAAPATARAAAAATAAAATGRHLDGSTASSSAGTDGSTGSSSGSCSERLTEQLTDLGLGEGASSSSSSRSDNGSNGCGAGGCFRLLESHGDQVGGGYTPAACRIALHHTMCELLHMLYGTWALACSPVHAKLQSASCIHHDALQLQQRMQVSPSNTRP